MSLKEYQGHTYLDVRMVHRDRGPAGEDADTLRLALIPEVIEALRQAEAAAREAGL